MIIMPLFGPFTYKNKRGVKFYLHKKIRGNSAIYYFSKNPVDAVSNLPAGFEIMENPKTGLPMLRRKKRFLPFGAKAKQEKTEEIPKEEKKEEG